MRLGVVFVAGALGVGVAAPASALTPDQVVLVVRRTDAAGARVARYYCEQRQVPRDHIIPVDLPGGKGGEQIPWRVYRQRVVEPLRAVLRRKKLVSSARCLLVAGAMPLKVEPDPQTPAEKREAQQIRDFLRGATLELYQQAWRVEQLSMGEKPGRAPAELPRNIRNSYEAEKYYKESAARAIPVVAKLPGAERRPLLEQLRKIRRATEGLAGLLEPEPTDKDAPDFKKRHAAWQKEQERVGQADAKLRELLDQRGPSTVREARRKKQLEVRGQIGLLRQLHSDLGELASSGRSSALDSELALLWEDNYPLNGTRPNPLRGGGIKTEPEPGQPPPAIMVARLDGFDPAQPIRMIDDAIAVEKAAGGLSGRFCIDAQGLPKTDRQFHDDQSILKLEEWTGRPASLTLVKDASLVPLAGPRANPVAFFAGWGSFDKFPDGYKCVQGAVVVTCNPAGLAELHNPRSRKWGNGWIAAGVAAVVGAVDDASPRHFVNHQDFAKGLLVDGLPLAEAFWQANHGTSWRVILIGDPLYRPVARKPPPGK